MLTDFGAGFLKVNSAALSSQTSCAPIFITQLLDAWLPAWLVTDEVMRLVIALGPALLVMGECTIGLLLWGGARRTASRRAGVLLALLLHAGIAATPAPNQITNISLLCISRLMHAMPTAFAEALREACSLPESKGGVAARALVVTIIAASTALDTTSKHHRVIVGIPTYFAFCLLGLRAAILDAKFLPPVLPPSRAATTISRSLRLGRLPRAVLGLTVLFSFVLPMVGVQDIAIGSPFASLSTHGDSNHWLLPTSLAHRLVPPDIGAVLQVDSTSSARINAIAPGEVTHELAPRVCELLRAVGHVCRQFAPRGRRALLLHSSNASSADALGLGRWGSAPFVPFTVPAIELRRLLGEARAQNESFELSYTHVADASPRTVRLVVDNGRTRSCRMADHGHGWWSLHWAWSECATSEPALQPPPTGILAKTVLFMSFPVIPGVSELACMD